MSTLPAAEEIESSGIFAQKNIEQLRSVVNKIEEQKDELYSRKSRIDEESGQMLGFGKLVETFASLMETAHDIATLEIVGFVVDKNKRGAIDLLKDKLHHEIADEYEIFTSNLDRRTIACIIAANRRKMTKIRGIFSTEGIQELSLPEEYADKSLKEVLGLLQEKKDDLPKEKSDVEAEINALGLKNINRLKKLTVQIQDRIAYFGEVPKFAETKFTFIMLGWLPTDALAELKRVISEAYQTSVIVEEEEIADDEKKNIPVTLQNRAYVKPFETIMGFFDPPAYGTIDPTSFLAIFFPIIFGMILGDIFYGLLLLAPAIWLWKSKRFTNVLHDIGFIFMVCATSTILFGLLYGEFLGDVGHLKLGMTPFVNRESGIKSSLAMAVGFGFVHITLSFVLRGIGAYREHNCINKHVMESVGFILLVVSVAAAALSGAGIIAKSLMTPILVVLACSIVMIIATGGLVAAIEIPGTLGNILSYARIMAIGLSSVILALVANKIAKTMPNMAAGIAIAFVLHTINFALGIFGPTIHGLRLHVVESFQKFAKFEGRPYEPFKRGGK